MIQFHKMRILIFSNTFYQILAKVASASTSLLLTILIVRYLGSDTYGEYSIVMSYVLVFLMFADFGINAIVVKDFSTSEKKARLNFSKILAFRVLSGLALAGMAVIVSVFFPYEKHIRTSILVATPIIIAQSISKAPNVIFQAYLKYKYLAISSMVSSAVSITVLYFLAISQSANLFMLMLFMSVSSLVYPALSIFFVRNYISAKVVWIDKDYWLAFFKDAIPLGSALLVNGLMVQVDRLLLSVLSVPVSVGLYSLAYKIFDLVLVLPTFFMNAYYPELNRIKRKSNLLYKAEIKKILVLLTVASLILTFLALKYSTGLIGIVWGADMIQASVPFNILMGGSILFFVTSPLSWICVIENLQAKLFQTYAFGLVINILLNLFLIPKLDYTGSALATILTEFFVLISLAYYLFLNINHSKTGTK